MSDPGRAVCRVTDRGTPCGLGSGCSRRNGSERAWKHILLGGGDRIDGRDGDDVIRGDDSLRPGLGTDTFSTGFGHDRWTAEAKGDGADKFQGRYEAPASVRQQGCSATAAAGQPGRT